MNNVCVLMVASGAAWESTALGLLTGRRGVVVLKRCVDVDDLLATATAGQADVAVLALDAHGLDAAAVEHLRRHRVRPVAITADPTGDPARSRAARIGVATLVGERDLEALPDAVLDADAPETGTPDQVAVAREDVVPPEVSVPVAGPALARQLARRLAGPAASSRSGDPPALRVVRRSRWRSVPNWPVGTPRPSSSMPTPTAAQSPSSWG